MLNTRTKTEFLDFSIVNEETKSAQRIPRIYFTRKIVNLVSAVKLLLLVDFPSFDKQIEALLEKAAESIKDAQKFLGSIGLIVTQVQNEQQIQKVKDYLKNLVSSPKRSDKIASIIGALHVQYEGKDDWNRLGFVESPSGSSLESYKMKDLERMIYETVHFARYDSNDFIYAPCHNELLICDSLLDQLRQKLSEGVRQIGEDMIDFHESDEKQMHDLKELFLYFLHLSNRLSSLYTRLSRKGMNPRQVMEHIVEYSKDVSVDMSSKNFQVSVNYAKYLVFLRGTDVPADNSLILNHLLPVQEYVHSSNQWYKFVFNLDKKFLSDWIVQKDISPYKEITLQVLNEVEAAKHTKNNNITESLKNLLSLIPTEYATKSLEDVKVTQLEVPKLESLKKLLSATLMHDGPNVKCGNTKSKKVTIIGSYVSTSYVRRVLSDSSKCDHEANFIEIFAFYKIFFDENLYHVGKNLHLTIIAPFWDVVKYGSVFIKLRGTDEGVDSHVLGIGRIFTSSILEFSRFIPSFEDDYGIVPWEFDDDYDDYSGSIIIRLSALNFTNNGNLSTVTIIGLEEPKPKINVVAPEGSIVDISIADSQKTPNTTDLNSERRKLLKSLSFCRSINSYKRYLREHQMKNFRESFLEKFSRLLADSEAVINFYDVSGLIDEFRGLEDQSWQLSSKVSLSAYRSLVDHILKYAKRLEDIKQLSQEKVIVLRYLYTAALSEIVSLENDADSNLVVELNDFLDITKNHVEDVLSSRNAQIIHGYERDYSQVFEAKIEEAQRYVTDIIAPEIDNTIKELDEKMLKLVDETVALQEATKTEKEQLIEKEDSLTNSLIASVAFGVIKFTSLFLAFLGPMGAAVSMGIIGITTITESLILDTTGINENALVKLPDAIKESTKPLTFYLNNKKDIFNQQLEDAQSMFNAFSKQERIDVKDIENRIKDAQNALKKEFGKGKTLDPASVDKMNSLRKEIKDLCSKKIKELEKNQPLVNSRVAKQLKIVGHVQTALSMVETSVNTYQNVVSYKSNIDAVGNLIQRADQKIEQLKQYERQIYSIIYPICQSSEAIVEQVQKRLQGKSSDGLIFSKWQIQSALRDVMKQIKDMTKGFKVQGEFLDIFNKVEEGINDMVELYNIMDEYQYKIGLGRFIAFINADSSKAVVTSNNDLNKQINDLMLVIQNNVLMQHYKVATSVVKRNVFPFAHDFFGYYDLPKNLETNNTTEIGTTVSKKLDKLKNELLKSNAVIYNHDKFVHQNIIFNGKKGRSKPFYTWKHNEHKNNIKKLLYGQKVVLKADIKHGFEGNAVKFNEIGIDFASPNKTIKLKLRKLLRDYSVTMTHLGHSFYRCDNRIYMIPNTNETIEYSMNRHRESHVPAITNMVYDKIAINKPVLSPYATWQIQLNHANNRFHELSKYSSEMIDLVLVGTGQYVNLNLPEWCNEQLDQYYVRSNNQIGGIEVEGKIQSLN